MKDRFCSRLSLRASLRPGGSWQFGSSGKSLTSSAKADVHKLRTSSSWSLRRFMTGTIRKTKKGSTTNWRFALMSVLFFFFVQNKNKRITYGRGSRLRLDAQ